MPQATTVQTNFTAGELSPRLVGRSDLSKYRNGLREQNNFISETHGGIIRRSGSQFVAEVKTSTLFTDLVRFEFSVDQTYMLEFGNLYLRIYRDKGRLSHDIIFNVSTASEAAGIVTVTLTGNHGGISVGDTISVQDIVSLDANRESYNGSFTVLSLPTATTITYALTPAPGTYNTGGTLTKIPGINPTEVVTPYPTADLAKLKFAQSADTLYIVHPDHAPRTLTRNAGNDADPAVWALTTFSTVDGPYFKTNVNTAASISVTAGAAGATSTVTISQAARATINGGKGFVAVDDIGRLLSWQAGDTDNWSFGTITTVTDATIVIVTLVTATAIGTDFFNWRIGAWGVQPGFPRAISFHKSRLWFASTPTQSQTHWGSAVGDFTNFALFVTIGPSPAPGSVLDDNAIAYTIDDDRVNTIFWMKSESSGLALMTNGGGFIGAAKDKFDPLTPLTYTVARQVTEGCDEVAEPHQVSAVLLFVKSAARKLLEFVFRFEDDRYVAPDLSLLAEHITLTGIVDTAYQTEPNDIFWCARGDGLLLGMTYERAEEVVAWHRHTIGGTLAGEPNAKVEAIKIIRDGNDDLLWMIVQRTVNGIQKRYIEFLQPLFKDDQTAEEGFFVDSGLTLDVSKAITGATAADPVQITSTAHGSSNGDRIRIRGVKGMIQINNITFLAQKVTADTLELTKLNGDTIDGTGFTDYVSGGKLYTETKTVTGLKHLEGETVKILVDGATHADKVVSGGGGVTLDLFGSFVHVGLSFKSRAETMPLVPITEGERRGATTRADHALLFLNRTLGGKLGGRILGLKPEEKLDRIVTRIPSDAMNKNPPLFTGVIDQSIFNRHGKQNTIVVETDDPLPMNVLSIIGKLGVNEV